MSRTRPKYTLKPEHEAQFGAWRDRWIANALNCNPMTDEERRRCVKAVHGMFAAAKLPHDDLRIVFVPSPFVLRVAAGFAAALWHLRSSGSAATDAATLAATSAATLDATRDATDAATLDATSAATSDATDVATFDATFDATRAATSAATRAAMLDATRAATDAATLDATRAATDAATLDAAFTATDEATDRYFTPWTPQHLAALAQALCPAAPELAKACAARWWGWDGGNQWSGWNAYLSFFQDVAKLDLKEYDAYQHYRVLAECSGPRIVHGKFVMISDRPCFIKTDDRNRPHCVDGPFTQWRDGSAIYAFHGVYVPASWAHGGLTVQALKATTNAEQRRVGVEVYGRARFLRDTGAKVLHADVGDRADARALVVDDEQKRWLVCTDGSTGRTYTMLVPSEVKTCAEAYTALCGVRDEDCVGAG